MKDKKTNGFRKIFSSANLMLVLIIIFSFGLINLIRQTVKFFSVREYIVGLETQITTLEKQSIRLDNLLTQSNADFYKEKEARLKFGLQKPDEKVAIIVLNSQNNKTTNDKNNPKPINPINWWDYFFR